MKNLTILFISIFGFVSLYSQDKNDNPSTLVKSTSVSTMDDGVLYGNELDPTIHNITINDLLANPTNYEGKTVNLKGDIWDVCQGMGCWTNITDGINYVLVQTLHKFFLPKDASGKISADGIFKLKEFTEEHAKEMAKESKNPKMKEEEIKGPQKVYVLEATGIRVFNK